MDKKPFEQRSGEGAGVQQESRKPEPTRRTPEESQKSRTPRRPAEPSEPRPVDNAEPGSEAELEGEDNRKEEGRSDQKSGRPVQLGERDKTWPFGSPPQKSGKTREGQSTQR